MTVSKTFSSRKAEFTGALLKSIHAATGPRKDGVSVLVSALWTELVRARLRASSYYEVERRLLPESFGQDRNGQRYYRNRWSKYAKGQHTPSKRLVDHVDQKLPGTKVFFDHPFWAILRNPDADVEALPIWRDNMLGIRPIIDQAFAIKGNENGISKVSEVKLQMLEKRPGLEAMAGLSILLLKAHSNKAESDVPFRIGQYLYRMTTAVCLSSPFSIAPSVLFIFVCKNLLAQAQHPDGYQITAEGIDFEEKLHLLSREIGNTHHHLESGSTGISKMKLAIEMLRGKWGFDIPAGLGPHLTITDQKTDTHPKVLKSLQHYEEVRLYNLENLRLGIVNRFAEL